MSDDAPPPRPPSLFQLFWAFTRAGLVSLGGGTGGWVRQIFVRERKWLADGEFARLLATAQILPGANMANLAVLVGTRLGRTRGALACWLGILLPPSLIVVALGILYFRGGRVPAAQGVLEGLGAGAIGINLGLALTLSWPLRKQLLHYLIVAAVYAGMVVWRLPLPIVAAVAFGLSYVWPEEAIPRSEDDGASSA